MTIREYYENYNSNKKYGLTVLSRTDKTIAEFYENCITKNVLDKDIVLAWHKMFMEYIEREDAIFWIRYYESGNKNSGRWNNRRACMTEFEDGFSYVFVSNYDAHEIFNMIRLGVTPSADEFSEMMNKHEFKLHYDSGKSCEESDFACFPKIGSTRGGILTPNHFYLAHINGIKSKYVRDDGRTCKLLDKSEVERIFPRGDSSDWPKSEKEISKKIRKLQYSLSPEEKAIVKAHFLRFVDPLNYYVVPGRDYETSDVHSRIGEYSNLNLYVSKQYESIYGKSVMEEFRRTARIEDPGEVLDGGEVINITYSPTKQKKKNAGADSTNKTNNNASSNMQDPFVDYMLNNDYSRITIKSYGSAIRSIEKNDGINLDLSNIDNYIGRYSKGGDRYNPNEHNTKKSALKKYKEHLKK